MKQEDFLLVVRELSKTFEGKKKAAVHPQNLQVQEGEVVALVGGSGSGKTTLLRMIAGLEEPDTGNVLFKGERVSGPSDQLIAGHPSIRLVHQHFELAHRLSVYDNITQKLRHLPREDQKEQTIELLEVCYLSHLSSQKVEALSGGEKQRLALARTLAEMPELLLLDEPFSNLDPILKEEIKRNLLTYIRRRGIATILVSHDPIDALSLADTIWVLENGSLMQEGRPKEVYFKPATPSVAALFGKLLVVVKEKLVTVLQEPARSYVQALPGELVGIRPEVWQQANGEDAHLQAEVLEVAFQGAASEAYVQLGSLSFSVYLPPFSTVNTSELLPLRLRLEFVQCW